MSFTKTDILLIQYCYRLLFAQLKLNNQQDLCMLAVGFG